MIVSVRTTAYNKLAELHKTFDSMMGHRSNPDFDKYHIVKESLFLESMFFSLSGPMIRSKKLNDMLSLLHFTSDPNVLNYFSVDSIVIDFEVAKYIDRYIYQLERDIHNSREIAYKKAKSLMPKYVKISNFDKAGEYILKEIMLHTGTYNHYSKMSYRIKVTVVNQNNKVFYKDGSRISSTNFEHFIKHCPCYISKFINE